MLILRKRALIKSRGPNPSARPQTVLITGASSGIGKVTALHLARQGHKVIGTSRMFERLADLLREARRDNLNITCVELNINDPSACERELYAILAEHGPVDVLVNNAGYGLWGPLQTTSDAELKTLFETNFFAAFRMTQVVLPGMIERRHGKIVNISSVLGRMGTPYNGAYAASKFALEGMSESLRSEVAPYGVRVSLVEPGLYRTNFQSNQVIAEGAQAHEGVYADQIRTYNRNHDRYKQFASDPIAVAKVIGEIVESPSPAFRYEVGLEARAGIAGRRFLPERLFNALMDRATVGKASRADSERP
jgi:short-subunit dehydrogenase